MCWSTTTRRIGIGCGGLRADGRGRIVSDGPEYRDAIAALVAKYPPYLEDPPDGLAIVVDIERVTGWTAGRK